MRHAPFAIRLTLGLLLVLLFTAPASADTIAESKPAAHAPLIAHVLPANKLFDYIRGNRSRMVQIATIAFGIGLVILMTATRKS